MLRSYQRDALTAALDVLAAGKSRLFVSPTGSGKSYIQAAALRALPTLVQLVPSIEIALGIYVKMTGDDAVLGRSADLQRRHTEAHRIYTVKRFLRLLLSAAVGPPRHLSIDEGHHSVDETHANLFALCAHPPTVLWTATAYRGTPDETRRLRAAWGDPHVVLTLRDAVASSVIAQPVFRVWPLLNDETVSVRNGEFSVSAVENVFDGDVVADLVANVRTMLCRSDGRPQRVTTVVAPGVATCRAIMSALRAAGVPAVAMTADDTDDDTDDRATRQSVFRRVTNRETVLVQVRVVGEGVDLPFRVMVDAAPTMSPLLWMQRVGRITRPVGEGEGPPVYYACNHNVIRHSYLWAGMIPAAQVKAAQDAWGPDFKPSRRILARAIGLEGFGKFAVSQIPLTDGTYASLYALQTPDGMHQYAVLQHPCVSEALYFVKANALTGKTSTFVTSSGHVVAYPEKSHGRWKRVADIPSADGYVSTKPSMPTPKMLAWWERSAEAFGLDPTFVPNAREFQVLPILADTRLRFRPEGG